MQAAHMTFEEEVIKSRAELRHLRQENARLKNANKKLHEKILRLEKENGAHREKNRLLRQEQQILKEAIGQQQRQLESLQLIVEELRSMVFGKKKKKDDKDNTSRDGNDDDSILSEQTKKRKSADRSPGSYRRDAPQDSEVTDVYEYPLTHCPDCGTVLIELKTIIRYVEDIQDLTKLQKLLKKIEKHIIGSGYCPGCRRRRVAKEVFPQMSILGEDVKKFIAYLVVIMRLSFEQVRSFLLDTANFSVSDGEITASLDEQAVKLTPEKDRLLQKIRGAPGRHYDETGWRVQRGGQGNYTWISRPTEGEEAVFLMGRSRGKGNAEELQGDVDNQVGISDDYAAYDNLFGKHQLCMSHPKRKLRDLAEAKTLSGVRKTACVTSYDAFGKLYKELEDTLATGYHKEVWLQKREAYINRLQEIAVISDNDPEKLKVIKQSLTKNAEKYFTCLLQPGIPADNNKAERGLRHVVLKRKISYGSKSQKGADTMSILCSALLSAWWSKPKNFFTAYNQMLAV